MKVKIPVKVADRIGVDRSSIKKINRGIRRSSLQTARKIIEAMEDEEQLLEEEKLLTLMYAHRPPEPLQGPLLLGVKAYLPIPKSKMAGRGPGR